MQKGLIIKNITNTYIIICYLLNFPADVLLKITTNINHLFAEDSVEASVLGEVPHKGCFTKLRKGDVLS